MALFNPPIPTNVVTIASAVGQAAVINIPAPAAGRQVFLMGCSASYDAAAAGLLTVEAPVGQIIYARYVHSAFDAPWSAQAPLPCGDGNAVRITLAALAGRIARLSANGRITTTPAS